MTFTAESETPRPSCGTTGRRAFQLLQKEKKKKSLQEPRRVAASRGVTAHGPRGGNRQAGAASGETENGHSAGRRGPPVHSLVPRNKGEAPRARATRLRPLRKVSNRRGRVLAWGPRLWQRARVSPQQETQRCPRRPLARLSRSEQIAPAAVRRRGVRGGTGARPREGHTGGPRCGER